MLDRDSCKGLERDDSLRDQACLSLKGLGREVFIEAIIRETEEDSRIVCRGGLLIEEERYQRGRIRGSRRGFRRGGKFLFLK